MEKKAAAVKCYHDPAWDFSDVSRRETTYLTHHYHTYPAKYIPHLVRKLICEYSPVQGTVLDPFCGSGTTCVEALVHQRQALGIDINPVAVLIAQAKTTPIAPKTLQLTLDKFWAKFAADDAPALSVRAPETIMQRVHHWFPNQHRPELLRLWDALNTLPAGPGKIFLQCAFSSILKYCSMWNPRSNKPAYFQAKQFLTSPRDKLQRQLKYMTERNAEFYSRRPLPAGRVCVGSATQTQLPAASVDLIATSPPYVTSYEYADLHQLSSLFLGIAHNDKNFRGAFTGSLYADRLGPINSAQGQKIVAAVAAADRKLSLKCHSYFNDINLFLGESVRVLKPGGHVAVVIGNAVLRGVAVANSEVFVEQMGAHGLKLRQHIKRKISSKMLPSTRDQATGKFVSVKNSSAQAYTEEFILVGQK